MSDTVAATDVEAQTAIETVNGEAVALKATATEPNVELAEAEGVSEGNAPPEAPVADGAAEGKPGAADPEAAAAATLPAVEDVTVQPPAAEVAAEAAETSADEPAVPSADTDATPTADVTAAETPAEPHAKVAEEGTASDGAATAAAVPSPEPASATTPASLAENPQSEAAAAAAASPPKPSKPSFNVDAKPFSPVALSDPSLGMVGDTNGLSIKIGQWNPQSYIPLPHMSPTLPVGVGHMPFVAPSPAPVTAAKKETSTGKDSLSAYAKPWSPHPEVAVAPIVPTESEVAIHPGSWAAMTVDGKEVMAPSPMVPKETSNNLFAHSCSIHPKGLKSVELELFKYACARCTLKTLYGRLSSRQPDVTMRNVCVDVPPLCVAHLIEQITKAKVTALHLNESEGSHYDIWLDKPTMSAQLVESMSDCVWTTPMSHGYAVVGKNDEGKRYLRNYVDRLRDSKPAGANAYDVALLEVREH